MNETERVSTATQGCDGNSLEEQTAALEKYGCQEIITEAFSGKTMERPKKYTPIQIEHALSLLSSGMSYKEVEEITGISKSTLIRAKNKEGAV